MARFANRIAKLSRIRAKDEVKVTPELWETLTARFG
jgi:hypothetical protein